MTNTRADLVVMRQRILRSLGTSVTYAKTLADFIHTFRTLGLDEEEGCKMATMIFRRMRELEVVELEEMCFQLFRTTSVPVQGGTSNLVAELHEQLQGRAQIIYDQVWRHLKGIEGSVIDFGCGDGRVTSLLRAHLGLKIVGCDVRNYLSFKPMFPFVLFDGRHLDVPDRMFEAGLLTNVLHHDPDNECVLHELDRIISQKLVILETVPVGNSESEMQADMDRTFMNDYIYNRLFHNGDVPVPGTFETPERWKSRFLEHGWKSIHELDLGIDQPISRIRHYLFVFERI
jgi:SAM-dependent methyltransferase